jgi:hypothetical protein
VLTSAIDFGQGDLDKVRRHLEAWYDGTMDRVSGWYKRSTQWIIFVTALIVVGVLNINTITILDGLYRNQALRAAVVNAAPHDANNLSYDGALVAFDKLRLPIGWDRGWGAPKSVQEQRLLVPKGPIPFDLWNDAFAPVLGLLITAFAATLGAPFWFDMLNKVTALRATLKPREKSPEEATQDREPVRGPAVNGARHELTLNVGPGVGTTTVSSGVQLQGADPEHDVDGCHERIELATLDEELPLAQGGVG